MATTQTLRQDITGNSVTTLLSTGLNSLANNSLAISGAFTPSAKQRRAKLQLDVTYGTNPTAGTGCSIWFIQSTDGGSTYEDGDASTTPAKAPSVVLPVRVTTSAQKIIRECVIPAGTCKVLLKNDGTGQAMAASGNTLKIIEIDDQAYTP